MTPLWLGVSAQTPNSTFFQTSNTKKEGLAVTTNPGGGGPPPPPPPPPHPPPHNAPTADDAAPTRCVRVKQITPLRWRAAGEQHVLQLLAVAPTPYRLTKNAKCLYRKPAYLICTDPNAPVARVLQYYLWRWDIEVNFRGEKTILGVGDAQVRTPGAVQNLTGCAVAAYAILLAAAEQCQDSNNKCLHLPPPKWQPQKTQRPTTNNLIRNLRYELWAGAIHFSGFAIKNPPNNKQEKRKPKLDSALFYASQF